MMMRNDFIKRFFSNKGQSLDRYYILIAFLRALRPTASRFLGWRVGAVLVKRTRLIKSASNDILRALHAEEVIITQSRADELRGSTLYVTLPPCTSRKAGPSCTEMIESAGIKRLVTLLEKDYNPRISKKGLVELEKNGLDVHIIDYPFLKYLYRLVNLPVIIYLRLRYVLR